MAIYTKTGDRGETKIFDKKTGKLSKISKSSDLISTIGAIDELNSLLGVVGESNKIQSDLFTINAILAGTKLHFGKQKTRKLEKEIDRLEGILPVQKNFIYYGGNPKATLLFFARAVCRRAERSVVNLSKKQKISEAVLIYMNRLSDYLFMIARSQNFRSDQKEEAWRR